MSAKYRSLITLLLLVAAALLLFGRVAAQTEPPAETATDTPAAAPIHPVFPLLDAAGDNVLDSGAPVSTMTTCGGCHDTAFIAANNFHSDVGLSTYGATGGAGLFGRWDPITYRYLSPEGDAVVDLTTPEWVSLFGARHSP